MKILITGGKGLVGSHLTKLFSQKYNVFSLGKEQLDITNREETIKTIKEIKPEIIIHTAAFTDVDGCEVDKEKAVEVNSLGTLNICLGASEIKAKVIYLSTDFVFDGNKKKPYFELDIPNPANFYGKTKLLGEYYVSQILQNFIILRTSKIFGKNGKNFASKLPFLIKEKEEIELTYDIINSPTYVKDLCKAIEFLIKKDFYGIINVSNKGECSWYEFGKFIAEELKRDIKIKPVSFKDFKNKKAERPEYSAFDLTLLETTGFKMPDWKKAMEEFINEI